MVSEGGKWPGAARALLIAGLLLFVANSGYGLAHEAAHAVVIDASGGQVYGIYVNVFGTDAYTEHTTVSGTTGLVLVNAAGICVTSLLAFIFAFAGQSLLGAFMAVRTSIYALNYSPGTDISTIHTVAGEFSIALSLLVVAVNLACICYVIKGRSGSIKPAVKRVISGLSSS